MRVTGPLFSVEAHGSLAGLFTAATSRGRQYMKKRTSPRVAYTPEQRSARARLGFLKRFWSHLNSLMAVDAQAEWAAIADLQTSTAYAKYLAYNMDRWTDDQGAIVYPGGGSTSGSSVIIPFPSYTATTAFFDVLGSFGNDQFGAVIYMHPQDVEFPGRKYIVWVHPYLTVGAPKTHVTLTNIAPGAYTFSKRTLSSDGTYGALDAIGSHTFP